MMMMSHLVPGYEYEDDVQVLENPFVAHRCCPDGDLRRRHLFGGVLDQSRPASAVRDHRVRGGYHGLGSRSGVLLTPCSLDVVKRRDVGNDFHCLARIVLLGGHSNGHGDRWCHEVEGWLDEVMPAAQVVRHWHHQLAVVLSVLRRRPPRTRY